MDAVLRVGKGLMEFWGVLRVESRRERTRRQCEIPGAAGVLGATAEGDDRGKKSQVS